MSRSARRWKTRQIRTDLRGRGQRGLGAEVGRRSGPRTTPRAAPWAGWCGLDAGRPSEGSSQSGTSLTVRSRTSGENFVEDFMPSASRGLDDAASGRCCGSTTKPWPTRGAPATPSPRPSRPSALGTRKPVGATTTDGPFTVSAPCSPNSQPAAVTPVGSRPTPRPRRCLSSPSRPNSAPRGILHRDVPGTGSI